MPPHELSDGIAHVLVTPAKAVHPTDHKHVASPQLVKQAATFGALDKATVET
jgi:hypothetical protein